MTEHAKLVKASRRVVSSVMLSVGRLSGGRLGKRIVPPRRAENLIELAGTTGTEAAAEVDSYSEERPATAESVENMLAPAAEQVRKNTAATVTAMHNRADRKSRTLSFVVIVVVAIAAVVLYEIDRALNWDVAARMTGGTDSQVNMVAIALAVFILIGTHLVIANSPPGRLRRFQRLAWILTATGGALYLAGSILIRPPRNQGADSPLMITPDTAGSTSNTTDESVVEAFAQWLVDRANLIAYLGLYLAMVGVALLLSIWIARSRISARVDDYRRRAVLRRIDLIIQLGDRHLADLGSLAGQITNAFDAGLHKANPDLADRLPRTKPAAELFAPLTPIAAVTKELSS